MKELENTHDLRLPEWGPYTKQYAGISHIADGKRGIRFDLSVFPGFYRRKVDVPNVMWESGFHPWEASPDLQYVSYRHELEWKDRIYADISYAALSERARLVRCRFVNNTELPQNTVLHWMSSLHAPTVRSHGDRLQTVEPVLPPGAVWTDALDYRRLAFARPRPSDNLVYDGFFRGEERGQQLTGGSGLGAGFGKDPGDRVEYEIELPGPLERAVLLVRYRMAAGTGAAFVVSGPGTDGLRLELIGSGEPATAEVALGAVAAGRHALALEALPGSQPVLLDGFAVAPASGSAGIRFEPAPWNPRPELLDGPAPNSLILKYEHAETYYGLAWEGESYEIRQFECAELDRFMRHTVHHHVHSVLKGDGEGHFANVFLRPIPLAPGAERSMYGLVCSGTREEVERELRRFAVVDTGETAWRQLHEAAQARASALPAAPDGEAYRFSQERMAATLLSNVVFPVYTKRSYIRHYTPGRWWDSLYTWDSGFIGIGLAELDLERAADCLNAYVTEPGDPHAAFIHHGSMVPVQHYLFLELWNRTRSRELLEHFYPRLRQYYLFYSGQLGSSTTRTLASGLLKTWDYFYNSGGWDDYPPQVEVHRKRLTGTVAPVSNTCHAIRIAKILRQAAAALGGRGEDIAEYDRDTGRFREAVETYAWDEESGYYGYVEHDANGRPVGLLRHESGENYNMGLDGIYPLVAGTAEAGRAERLLRHLDAEGEMWCEAGISTVDRRAPYYRHDGYWNGAVWMPHQWFFWKSLLDWGRGESAFRIARTALELWRKETEATYNCYEHFIVQTGRGAGWHQFGGLSAPVLNWYHAYYRPGRVTAGLDVWIEEAEFHEAYRGVSIRLVRHAEAVRPALVLATLQPGGDYAAAWNGRPAPLTRRTDCCWEAEIGPGDGMLVIAERHPMPGNTAERTNCAVKRT